MSRALLSKTLIFAAGAATGSVVTWKVIETKYKRIADEEIASVKEAFSQREVEQEIDIAEEESEPDPKKECDRFIDKLGYTSYSDSNKTDKIDNVERPYVIKPEECGELPGYEVINLTYYADGKLADDMDELVEDVNNVVGLDSLKTFGMYEDDSVFVRNDRLKCDYEIIRSLDEYAEVIGSHPEEE